MRLKNIASTAVFYLLICSIFISVTYLCSKTTETIAQMIPVERQHTIVIDAGHGGEDGGAISCTGVTESKYNLEIALKLNDLLHLMGYDTRMVRTTDTSVYTEGKTIAQKKVSDLQNRVRLAEETNNAVFLSIHQNTFQDSRYRGAQVFYADTIGSREVADAIQNALISALNPGSNRQSKPAESVYLMQHVSCTAVLVECGFLSNPEEEANLRNAEYQKKLSCVLAATLANYLDHGTND